MLRDIVETSPDGIWVFDVAGRTHYVNPTMAAMLGRDREELLALPPWAPFDAVAASGG